MDLRHIMRQMCQMRLMSWIGSYPGRAGEWWHRYRRR